MLSAEGGLISFILNTNLSVRFVIAGSTQCVYIHAMPVFHCVIDAKLTDVFMLLLHTDALTCHTE